MLRWLISINDLPVTTGKFHTTFTLPLESTVMQVSHDLVNAIECMFWKEFESYTFHCSFILEHEIVFPVFE